MKTSMLDVGCGRGEFSSFILERAPNIRQLVGLDVSKEYIRKARIENPSGNAEFLVADGQSIPFKNGCFGLTICKDPLHHVRRPSEVLKEISRVSRARADESL
jgi:ubiquinone/menaquinone biosynthesis C-methylase UbiE